MNCKNCNTPIPENQIKCPNCGTDNLPETEPQARPANEYISAAGTERAVPKGFSSKKNIIIIIIAAIVLIIGGISAVAVGTNGFDFTGIRTTLQLADRYLSEQNYEQAIIEFEKVLEIEPMNVDAYLGLAEAYIALGETDKAVKILEEGIEKTGSDRLRDKLEEIRESLKAVITEAEVTTDVKTEPAVTELPVEVGTVTILGVEYDIGTTTSLDLHSYGYGITDEILRDIMPEIKKLTNLTLLDLQGNQIADIAPLAQLTNLTELYLCWNQITDITPLAQLTNLTELQLDLNQITDITPLAQLTNLTWLDLGYNQITDITPLAQLTNLTWLDLRNNPISHQDIESLKSKLPNCKINTF